MTMPIIKNVTVLGAGVMGRQIAAHFANAGMKVALLDRVVDSEQPDSLGSQALKELAKPNNRDLMSKDKLQLITIGNLENPKKWLKKADLIIEAVAEDLKIKHDVWEIADKFAKKKAIMATNTSGIPIAQVAANLSSQRQERFMGMHFFNPPRFMRLLELIPLPSTQLQLVVFMKAFAEVRLGKGVIIAKDTINFIGNRLGVFATLDSLRRGPAAGFSLSTVDALTGQLIGRPKAGTFRTGDLVGLDILANVAKNMESHQDRDLFELPEILTTLVKQQFLGQKTGSGFYRKDPKLGLLEYSQDKQEYLPVKAAELPILKATKKLSLAEKVEYLFTHQEDAYAQFSWESLRNMMWYSANAIPEISDDFLEIDRALVWGFNWEVGIFKMWDMLGKDRVIENIEKAGLTLPSWVKERQEAFYPGAKEVDVDLPGAEIIKETSGATIIDLGDNVLGFKINTRHNTITNELFQELNQVLDELEKSSNQGLVIFAPGKNFSVGANLYDLLTGIKTNSWLQVTGEINYFQQTTKRLKYFTKPVVTVVHGRVLGGGAELMLHSPFVVADAESYIGLVEIGVGLIPGGGGTKEMLARSLAKARFEPDVPAEKFLREHFTTIFSGFVSSSAFQAKEKAFLRDQDLIVMNHVDLLSIAKAKVIFENQAGFRPAIENPLVAMGEDVNALFTAQLLQLQAGQFISDHDFKIGQALAELMTLGNLVKGAELSEDAFLKLEKELFIALCQEEKSEARITQMLQTGKPLRN